MSEFVEFGTIVLDWSLSKLMSAEYCKEFYSPLLFFCTSIINEVSVSYKLLPFLGTCYSMFFCRMAVFGLEEPPLAPFEFADLPKKKKFG